MNYSSGGRLSNNEKKFIVAALRAEQRVDGRRPFDARRLTISFGKEDGAVEVQQGRTKVMANVTGQLSPPYPDRPTEGSLIIFTEFSPMADPGFEAGRPGELAVELGRVIDRGLRESRAVDTESLCVLAGRAVWSIRVDLHIVDNGGNLVDVANVAALAALSSYRRPECSVGGSNGQEVIVHPPEVRDPIPLILHHYPIAVTFAFFGDGDLQALDPSVKEEAVMGGRLTVIVNSQGDVCGIQKGGGIGVRQSEIMRCVRIALSKAVDVTNILKKAIDANSIERAQRKIKRHRNVGQLSVKGKKVETVQGDEEMQEEGDQRTIPDEERAAIMDILKAEEMENESSSGSESDDVGEFRGQVGDKRLKVDLNSEPSMSSVAARSSEANPLFKGGVSSWNAGGINGSDLQKGFDSEAMEEFEHVSGAMQHTVSARQNSTSPFLDIKSGPVGTLTAATVYAHMSAVERKGTARPLGPVFPKPEMSGELGETASENIKLVPTSLLDAVKKSKKRKM